MKAPTLMQQIRALGKDQIVRRSGRRDIKLDEEKDGEGEGDHEDCGMEEQMRGGDLQ